MRPDLIEETKTAAKEPGLVSGRFLSDLFSSLERHNVPATQMLGDLPIPIDEAGRVTRSVEWTDFTAFMQRLEHHIGGPEELEACGERVGELRPARAFRSFLGFSASPYSLYRAASLWAVRRALPGIETRVEEVQPNGLAIHVRIRDGLRPCPQLLHLTTGVARVLPRILGMRDAVVTAEVRDFEAHYQITVPPSRTLWARVTRVFRTLFSASSVLQFLEAQQLELHAKHDALQKTNAALAESERRYRAITDTAVDVLCEINEQGQIEYVSASVEDLMGYSPEQVAGSHFSLWIPTADRDLAKKRFEEFASQPLERAITRERLHLHTESGGEIVVELSLRSYRTPEGELRMVGIVRDQTHRPTRRQKTRRIRRKQRDRNDTNALRSTVERLRDSRPENSIDTSLAALLAALDANASAHDASARHRIVAATARMTQIVERSLVHPPDHKSNFRWLETKKRVEMIQYEFLANSRLAELELQIDVSSAPSVVWGKEALLAAGLGSLLDWAAERAQTPFQIALRVEASVDRTTGNPAVDFLVSTASSTGSRRSEDEASVDATSELALATTEDATIALGGVLILEDETSQCPTGRIHLSQPKLAD